MGCSSAFVREERQGFQARTTLLRDREGHLIAEHEKVLSRWAEHFEELLDQASESGWREKERESIGNTDDNTAESNTPSLWEVNEAIKSLQNHKAPGEDTINAELLKYGGEHVVRAVQVLIGKVWKEEQMPEDWKIALICPIHKKGTKLECSNYRGISLLSVVYKVITKIIARRLEPYAEKVLGEYQCGFRRNRSTTDQIFTLRILLEKCYEFNIPVHQLFVDFRQAYDSIERHYLYETLRDFKVPKKLRNLIEMTLADTKSKVTIGGKKSRTIEIKRGLRQGDALSCILFNMTLERAIRKVDINPGGTLLNRTIQILGYADDIGILSRTEKDLKETYQKIEYESRCAGLKVNEEKTKYMIMRRNNQITPSQHIMTENSKFECVQEFKYLGAIVTANNENTEIKERLKAGNRAYYSLQKLLKSRLLSRYTKKNI